MTHGENHHDNVRALAFEIGPHLDPLVHGDPVRSSTGDLPGWPELQELAAFFGLSLKHQLHRTRPGCTTTLGSAALAINLALLEVPEGDADQLARAAVHALLREFGVLA